MTLSRLLFLLRLGWQIRVANYAEDRIIETRCVFCKAKAPHSYDRHISQVAEEFLA